MAIRKVIKAYIELHWGYSVKKPLYTATQPSFKIPPPTALLGALAYSASVIEGDYREIVKIGDDLGSKVLKYLDVCPWVTYRLLDHEFRHVDTRVLAETKDIVRIIQSLGVRTEHIRVGSPMLWGIATYGKVFMPGSFIEALFMAKEEGLEKYVWGLTRLGTRESIISVSKAESVSFEVVNGVDEVETVYLFPKSLAMQVRGEYDVIELPKPQPEWFIFKLGKVPSELIEHFIVPVKGSVKVRPSSEACVIKIYEPKETYVLIPRYVVK